MAKKVAIAVVHGIGEQTPGFSTSFIEKLTDFLNQYEDVDVISKEICWQTQVQPRENRLIDKLDGMGWMKLRNLFINYGADAIAYQPIEENASVYADVHKIYDISLKSLWREADHQEIPLIIIAHSLGTVVTSNFLWDCFNKLSKAREIYEPSQVSHVMIKKNLKLIVTLGSPIAVWSLRYENGGKSLKLPKDTKWLNIYSEYDVIGYPLTVINSDYCNNNGIEDMVMNVGGLLTRYTPVSHVEYMDDLKLIKVLAKEILLKLGGKDEQ